MPQPTSDQVVHAAPASEPVTAVDPFASRSQVAEALAAPGVDRLAVQERPAWLPEGVITDLDLVAKAGEHPK